MKYQKIQKIILPSFLLLALIVIGSTQAHASEVTGTLSGGSTPSTSGGGGGGGGGGTPPPSSGGGSSGSLSGSVSGGTTSGGGNNTGGNGATTNRGSVLGASTGPAVSSDGTALQSSKGLAVDYDTTPNVSAPTDTSTVTPAPVDESYDNTAAVGGISSFSAMTWFWIILLILLLVGAIIYIYKRNNKNPAR